MTGPDAFYTNLFTHYRPLGDPEWYLKPNHEGAPDPIMEVEGECRLKNMGTTETRDGQFGFVQGVECDDKRLQSSISPTLFQAKGPDDLMRWWQMTSPPTVDGEAAPISNDEL